MQRRVQASFHGALLLSAALLPAGPAAADVALCNVSEVSLTIASAYVDTTGIARSAVGHGTLAPAECQSFSSAVEDDPSFYLYIEGLPPADDSVTFCLRPEPDFYISADEPCTGPGDELVQYSRFIQPDEGQDLVLNLDGRGGFLPAPDLPMIDASQPFQPFGPVAMAGLGDETVVAGTGEIAATGAMVDDDLAEMDEVYSSGLTPGSSGPSFELSGVWEGCSVTVSEFECRFHAMFTRFTIYDDEAHPPGYIDALTQIPGGTEVSVIGDVLQDDGFEVVAVLSEVRAHAQSPFMGLYHAVQGIWVSEEDPGYHLWINGSEITAMQSGRTEGVSYFALGLGCGEEASEIPSLTAVATETGEEICAEFDSLTDDRLVLVADGVSMAYHRP